MKLQTKLSLTLILAVLTVYLGSCFFQNYLNLRLIDKFSQQSQTGEVARQWQWVESVQHATDASLVNAMMAGDMDQFEKILVSQRQVPGLQELSLIDNKGRVDYSSDPGQLKMYLPADLKETLLTEAQPVKRLTEGSFEIYQPVKPDKQCLECHTEWKAGQIGGVMKIRFSSDSMKEAQASWGSFASGFHKSNTAATGMTLAVLVLVLGAVVVFIIHREVAAPLNRIAGNLLDQAAQVNGASGQLTATSQTLAEGSSEQASSLEETSSSLEEMSSMTKRNAENTGKANQLAKQARSAADRGVGDMATMATAMNDIKGSSDDIAKIIKTIDEIAFQTNILALNAAVEAARAGEAGLGFAVVADEVRNLAQRCAQAAKETSAKIEGAIAKSGQGVQITGKVASALNEIVIKARQVDELVAEVAGASREQTEGIAQINMAVGQMDKVTQSNAATAEESAAAAEELNAHAETMRESVAELMQLIGGKNQTGAARSPRPPRTPDTSAIGRRNPAAADNGRTSLPAPAGPRNDGRPIPLEQDVEVF